MNLKKSISTDFFYSVTVLEFFNCFADAVIID